MLVTRKRDERTGSCKKRRQLGGKKKNERDEHVERYVATTTIRNGTFNFIYLTKMTRTEHPRFISFFFFPLFFFSFFSFFLFSLCPTSGPRSSSITRSTRASLLSLRRPTQRTSARTEGPGASTSMGLPSFPCFVVVVVVVDSLFLRLERDVYDSFPPDRDDRLFTARRWQPAA